MTHIDSPTPTLPSRRSALARTLTVAATLGIAAAATLGAGSPGTATAAGSVTGEACEVGEGVTVVVDFTDRPGGVVVGCAPGEQPSGFAALAAAGFTTGFEGGPNMLCTVNGQPTEGYPYCWTTGGFWSYWKKTRGGTWGFSPVGGSAGPVAVDAVEGWSWAPGFKSNAPGGDETSAPPSTTTTTTEAPTTTTTSTSTTSAPAQSTSTTPSTTTSPGSGGSIPGSVPSSTPATSTTSSAGVGGAGQVRDRPLPRTGSDPKVPLMVGLVLVAAGAAALNARRRQAGI